jgi:hypothetical protein
LNLLGQKFNIPAGDKGKDLKTIAIASHDIERAHADRPGRSKDCECSGGHAFEGGKGVCALCAKRLTDHIMSVSC